MSDEIRTVKHKMNAVASKRFQLECSILLLAAMTHAMGLEIPLTVSERAGVERRANHVNSGIPFPQGALKETTGLSLSSADGKAVPASFIARQKWLKDGYVRWATVHFLSDVPANGTVKYVVRESGPAAPAYPLKTESSPDKVTVDTGALKFSVTKQDFNLLNEVWFDPAGKGSYSAPVVQAGSAKLVADMASGDYKVVNKAASVNRVGKPFEAVARLETLEIEETTPVRAVVKAAGQFMNDNAPTLDFVARVYAMSGSAALRIVFTVVNRRGSAWNAFHGFNELALKIPAKLGSPVRYTIGLSEDDDAQGVLKEGERASILQPYSENYFLGSAASGQGKAKSILSRRIGWADITGPAYGMTVGIRYFWQLHPKGIWVSGDGTACLQIVPRQEKKVEVPQDVVSQTDTRIDFFTGAARTHELLVAFHAPSEKPASHAISVVDPLFAACPTSWYCQETMAEGLLWDANPENFKLEYRELVTAYQAKLEQAFNECAGKARRGGKRGIEEYGFFNFGAGTESKGIGTFITPGDWLNTRWDGNYYDFPRAALVNFWRTGNFVYWDVAQDSALHLADIDIAHANPGNPKLAGIEHTCPNRGHFRQWWGGEPFGVSGNMDSTKSQSLYDIYHMTGDAWFADCGLLVASYSMNHTGGALRAIANRSKNLIEAYEHTGDKKYWDSNIQWLAQRLLTRPADKSWDQYWMYGMASEVLMDTYRETGDAKWAQAVVNCCDSLINCHWIPDKEAVRDLYGFSVICFGHAYELTGNEMYLKKGLSMLKATSLEYVGATKTFAQGFRISPYMLHYLTNSYKPPNPIIEKSNATK